MIIFFSFSGHPVFESFGSEEFVTNQRYQQQPNHRT
ncbi:hypothetical protein SAMN05421690_11051, partial [Nitrosomonas sp. Nm51]